MTFLKQKAVLYLPSMAGKSGKIIRGLAKLAQACEVSIQFSLGRTHLTVTFNPMDLRRLPEGTTLEQVKRAEIAASGKKPRGRPRKDAATHYAAHRVRPIRSEDRPVHPEWRAALSSVTKRAIGLDLNPQWIGVTVIDVLGDPQDVASVKILDHQLHRIDIPADAPREQMVNAMACAAHSIISLARAWNCGLVVHEEGLGKLRSGGRNRRLNQVINFWSRNALIDGLKRRCDLASINLQSVWGGYSSTIGNLCFDLPDACASAAEIARRGFAASCDIKDRLPAVPPQLARRRWKDDEARVDLDQAATWQEVHRTIKSAKTIGYRRLHPATSALGSGSFVLQGRSYAVDRLGKGKRSELFGPSGPDQSGSKQFGPGVARLKPFNA